MPKLRPHGSGHPKWSLRAEPSRFPCVGVIPARSDPDRGCSPGWVCAGADVQQEPARTSDHALCSMSGYPPARAPVAGSVPTDLGRSRRPMARESPTRPHALTAGNPPFCPLSRAPRRLPPNPATPIQAQPQEFQNTAIPTKPSAPFLLVTPCAASTKNDSHPPESGANPRQSARKPAQSERKTRQPPPETGETRVNLHLHAPGRPAFDFSPLLPRMGP